MAASKSSETALSSGETVSPRAKTSPLAITTIGVSAYLLLAWAVNVVVLRMPGGNRLLHILLLTLLALAFVAAAEGFLALIRAISPTDMLGWPFRAAAVGSVAYSLAYGHRVFVNYWYWDDWGYLLNLRLNQALFTTPLNDHFEPLLKILLWAMSRTFGFNYIGAACLQQVAFLLIVLVLAHLLWSATRRPWLLIVLIGVFAMWPSYGIARTWFGGGFWLTASAALLALYVLHARRLVFDRTMRFTDIAVSAVLAAATVFISSQTLVPAVYLAAFCAPALLLSRRRIARMVEVRRLGILCALSLVPTAVALWGRSVYVDRPPLNPSGLFDGRLFTNLGVFILSKGLFGNSFSGWRPPVALVVLLLLPLAAAAKKLVASKVIDSGRRAALSGLILGGCSVFVLPIAQIGMGRRWDYDAVTNTYYVTMPFLGLWLAWAGIGLALSRRAEDDAPAPPARSVAFASVFVVAAAGLSAALTGDGPPLKQRLELIHTQREFVDSLGAAVCDLALLHPNGPAVRWVPSFDLSSCRVCQDIIGPPEFLHPTGKRILPDPVTFGKLARFAAARRCSAADIARALPTGSAAQAAAAVTDGSESKVAMSFIRKYLAPLDPTAIPEAVSRAKPQNRGYSSLGWVNGKLPTQDGRGRVFLVKGGSLQSCIGWAFDEGNKSTPEEVWIEFTHSITGQHYYWRAIRYSRPELADSFKLPSIRMAGIKCQEPGILLLPGTYTTKIYQAAGTKAIVSDLNTYESSPVVVVE